jgi:hypothetical protein
MLLILTALTRAQSSAFDFPTTIKFETSDVRPREITRIGIEDSTDIIDYFFESLSATNGLS